MYDGEWSEAWMLSARRRQRSRRTSVSGLSKIRPRGGRSIGVFPQTGRGESRIDAPAVSSRSGEGWQGKTTVSGAPPFAAILGCADSRVAPELAFDQRPGDLFVVRVAGNFVTPDGLGSLEFGASVLGTKLIMVLGHSSCGAVNATVAALQKENQLPGHIADLVRAMKIGIAPVLNQSGGDLEQQAVIANVRHNVEQLKQAKPILAAMVAKNEVRVVGGVYDLATGTVTLV